MYPHRIRLRGPWDCQPLESQAGGKAAPLRMTLPCRWRDGGLGEFAGRVRFTRRFGFPGRIDPDERVWLVFEGIAGTADVVLNGTPLGRHASDEPFEFEITGLLSARNQLQVEVEAGTDGGIWGDVALEVRASAFLRDVRCRRRGNRLHVSGAVAGTCSGPLELYVLVQTRTVAYAAVQPGLPFELVAHDLPAEAEPVARVELVHGATVWYTVECPMEADA